MKRYFITLTLLFAAIAIGCASKGSEDEQKDNDKETDVQSENVITVSIKGDEGLNYTATSEKARVAYINVDYANSQVLLFNLVAEKDDKTIMSSGFVNLDYSKFTEQVGAPSGYMHFNADKGSYEYDLRNYESLSYPLYYHIKNPDESSVHVTLAKVEKVNDKFGAGLLHIEGKYKFKAATIPDPSKVPQAALDEAMLNSKARNNNPPMLAELAGVKYVEVSGTFSVTFVAKFNPW